MLYLENFQPTPRRHDSDSWSRDVEPFQRSVKMASSNSQSFDAQLYSYAAKCYF